MKTDMDYIAEQCAEIDRRQGVKPTSSCMVDSVVGCLGDAVRGQISMRGQALLQWGFMSNGFAAHSVQMPEEVVDQILRWRDQSLAPNDKAQLRSEAR